MEIDILKTPKTWWLNAALYARLLPTDGKRTSVAMKSRYILKQFNIEQGTVTMRVEKNPWLASSSIRRAMQQVLSSTEEQTTVRYAMENLVIVREKVPTIHRDGRQHRGFAKGTMTRSTSRR